MTKCANNKSIQIRNMNTFPSYVHALFNQHGLVHILSENQHIFSTLYTEYD